MVRRHYLLNVYFPVTCHAKYEEYISCVLVSLVPYLNPMKRIMYAYWETLSATAGSPRFNEMCDMLHKNNVMFRDTDILPDNTYTHVNNCSQTCSWLDHIAISDVLSESTVDSRTLQDVACSDHCVIAVTVNFDRLPMTHSIERQKIKHINWKFDEAGVKCRFYKRLDSMLNAAPAELLPVNRARMQIGLMIC